MAHPILIVEDAPAVLQFVVTILKAAGHEVLTAYSTAEARKVLAAHPELTELCLVVDLVLDDDSGLAFAREVLQAHPGFRVVLTSGFTDEVLMTWPQSEPQVRFLRKPFTKAALLDAVDSVCRA